MTAPDSNSTYSYYENNHSYQSIQISVMEWHYRIEIMDGWMNAEELRIIYDSWLKYRISRAVTSSRMCLS